MADITIIRLQEEFVYLVVLVDIFTRGIRGWHLDSDAHPRGFAQGT